MEDGSIPILISLAILLLLSGYFSATETAFSAFNRVRLKNLAAGGNTRAERTLALAENYDKLLSTILIGNNIVNIAMASLGTILFVHWYGDPGVTISTIVITVVVLIFGEITPKSMAKEWPEKFAMASTPMLKFFIVLLAPLNFFFMLWKKLVSKLFGQNEDNAITEEEILLLVDEGNEHGTIDVVEKEMITNIFEFDDLEAGDVMTHRTDLVAVEKSTTIKDVINEALDEGVSRIPVYNEDIDDVVGLLYVKDLLRLYGAPEEELTSKTAGDLMRKVLYVAESTRCHQLFRRFKEEKNHFAVVVDEYGGTAGVVTMEDLLETIVGNIQDEYDTEAEDVCQIDANTWLLQGSYPVSEVERLLDAELDPEEDADTIGGLVMNTLGRIPGEEEIPSVEIGGITFTVIKVEDRRIVEVRACKPPKNEEVERDS